MLDIILYIYMYKEVLVYMVSNDMLESILEGYLRCAYLRTKSTAKTLVIVASYIEIEDLFESPVTIVDLYASFDKCNGRLSLNYEIPLMDYREDVEEVRHVERKRVKRERSYGKVHKTNDEPEYIEVKGTIRGYENDMTRIVDNPDYEEWDEPDVHTWMEDVEEVSFNRHVNKTFVQDFNERQKAIKSYLKQVILSAISGSYDGGRA